MRIGVAEDVRFDPPFKDRGQFLEVFVAKFAKIPLESGRYVNEPPLSSGIETGARTAGCQKTVPDGW